MVPTKTAPTSRVAGRPKAMQVEKKNPSATSEASPAAGSGIFIKEVRIRNFRCLLSVDVELDKLTVLIGQNNSGKTSFLNAFFAAVGAGQRIILKR
jgi:AAA ATPase domain